MKPFNVARGPAVLMLEPNIDTDQMLPKQFLRVVERSGLGEALFYDLRHTTDGRRKPEAELNRVQYQLLFGGENFGCGSSREHAAWALDDYGLRCIVAPSFADIFSTNCGNNGILLVRMPAAQIDELAEQASEAAIFEVDLEQGIIRAPDGADVPFDIDPHLRTKLLFGLDEIETTLSQAEAIIAFEDRQRARVPWLS